MVAYVGDTRAKKLLARLRAAGIGQCIVRGRLKGRRLSKWFYDNGAFEDWRAERDFNEAQFLDDISTILTMEEQPDFVVVPDIVAGGLESLEFSLAWRERLPDGLRYFLAVQDGMEPHHVREHLVDFCGIFVGGTLEWKLKTMKEWCELAREESTWVHIGRVGTKKRVIAAQLSGADSIDSCLPLWSKENERAFLGALRQEVLPF